jgi:hypothetical protein
MEFISKLFGKKATEETGMKTGGMEDFMTLIKVYFQSVMAVNLHITNLNALPDLRVFKTTLRIPTQGGVLGVAEKKRCKEMLKEMYEMDDNFFKEIDQSIGRRCRKLQDAQPYAYQFSGFMQDLMMLTVNLLKYKLRLPSFFKKAIYQMTESTVNDIFNKNDFTDPSTLKTVVAIRENSKHLGFSQQWATGFVFRVIMLSKKEKRPEEKNK